MNISKENLNNLTPVCDHFETQMKRIERANRIRNGIGWGMILLSLVVGVYLISSAELSLAVRIGLYVGGLILAGVAVHWLISGKAIRGLALECDPRPPFLVSRSFGEKHLVIGPPRKGEGPAVYSGRSVIEEIDRHLGRFGRLLLIQDEDPADFSEYDFVAIKDKDQWWQETFLYLAASCRAVFVLPAASGGVRKELLMLIDNNYLDKTLVYMPPVSSSLAERWTEKSQFTKGWRHAQQQLRQEMGLNLPDYTADGVVYVPNADLSIRQEYPLLGLEARVAEAPEALIPADDPACRPLSEIVAFLKRSGFAQTSLRTFER
jgi:hypothetical protein